MTTSRHEARTLAALAATLRATDPDLAALLAGRDSPGRAVPGAGRTRDRREIGGPQILSIVVGFLLGAVPLAVGALGGSPGLVQVGAPIALVVPLAVMSWVCLRPARRGPTSGWSPPRG